MIRFESDCIGCETCMNCGAKKVAHFYCDDCDEEFMPDELVRYGFGKQMLCAQCLFDQFERVTSRDCYDEYELEE